MSSIVWCCPVVVVIAAAAAAKMLLWRCFVHRKMPNDEMIWTCLRYLHSCSRIYYLCVRLANNNSCMIEAMGSSFSGCVNSCTCVCIWHLLIWIQITQSSHLLSCSLHRMESLTACLSSREFIFIVFCLSSQVLAIVNNIEIFWAQRKVQSHNFLHLLRVVVTSINAW